ncbi:uncharacterized protein C8Q71DRAFT_702214 [Rhodofomes roseus]|uniref:F-box domain-containing protein n=1 Tax=Rhodofomes roseus TaxID=34475 RepID=A0ABQ8KRU2_9APHY|nr:uncharacterized protein C8Q71DRAFT_702214 [Rhodofomes roseus]KAH9841153.1 hypothetical protein C8Q71DRAFT_702214 [Rhodofomes roseus]
MLPSLYSSSRMLCLPVEIVIPILSYLDYKGLLTCRAVCRAFHDVVKRSLELQYKIELAADGLVDGVGVNLTTAERLALLLDRRKRWRTLDWMSRTAVSVPGACQAYELVDGVFAKSMMSGAPLYGPGSHHLNATWLPTRAHPPRSLVREDIGVATRDFAIDPSQDLIAFVDADNGDNSQTRIQIYLRTISTNARHPHAALPELVAPIPFELGSSFIQIVDDVVGMFFWVHGPGLIIWNWQTAEVVVKRTSDGMPASTWDFSFLSSRAYMVTATSGAGSIELYSFSGRPGTAPHHFATHSGPFVRYQTPGRAFTTAREKRVHLMSLHYGERGPRFHMFVLNKFLMSFLPPEGEARPWAAHNWKAWGPENTRFLEHNVNFQWLRYVHGTRVVLPPFFTTWPVLESTVCVLDFNVHPKRIEHTVLPEGSSNRYQLVTDPSRVPAGTVFQEDVITSLPYSATTRSGKFQYSGFMIDDERIIGMKQVEYSVASRMPRPLTSHHTLFATTTFLSTPSHQATKSPEVLLAIPDCVAAHVLGETTAELGRGDLTLVLTTKSEVSAPAAPSATGASQHPLLTLAVGSAAFPLFKTTTFGTINDDERVYVFTPEIGGEHVAGQLSSTLVRSYVKITLPEGVTVQGSPFEKLQTQFEEILVHHGLLKEGIEAVADEVGKSMREGSANVAQTVRKSTSDYSAENPPTDAPLPVPGVVHSAASTSASGTGTLTSAVGSVTGLVSSAAGQAGAWIAAHVVPTTTPATQTLSSVSNAWDTTSDGYVAGTTEVKSAVADAAGVRVENEFGQDTRAVAEDTGTSVQNVSTVVGDVLVTASGTGLATAGLKGAARTQLREQEAKDQTEEEDEKDKHDEEEDGKLEDISF